MRRFTLNLSKIATQSSLLTTCTVHNAQDFNLSIDCGISYAKLEWYQTQAAKHGGEEDRTIPSIYYTVARSVSRD